MSRTRTTTHTTPTARQAKRAERLASEARMEAAREETRQIVAAGKCPQCGRKVKRNLALTGWYQCEQFGAPGFRADATQPSCNWQGFTQ